MSNFSAPREHELMRARGGFSWTLLTDSSAGNLTEQFATAQRLVECTRRHGLLTPTTVGCEWVFDGVLVPGLPTTVQYSGPLDDPALPGMLIDARADHIEPAAQIDAIELEGAGSWIDAGGDRHAVDDLLRLTVDLMTPAIAGVYFEVYHDIWMTHDFRGRAQYEIHERNAPRLTAMIEEFESILDAEADPDPDSMFGKPRRYGIDPSLDDDGMPMDVTWWM